MAETPRLTSRRPRHTSCPSVSLNNQILHEPADSDQEEEKSRWVKINHLKRQVAKPDEGVSQYLLNREREYKGFADTQSNQPALYSNHLYDVEEGGSSDTTTGHWRLDRRGREFRKQEIEWAKIEHQRAHLECERVVLFQVIRAWRKQEHEDLAKEERARKVLKLLLKVNVKIEEEMHRQDSELHSANNAFLASSRRILACMETEESKEKRRLSLVVDILTMMARAQLDGNLLPCIQSHTTQKHAFSLIPVSV